MVWTSCAIILKLQEGNGRWLFVSLHASARMYMKDRVCPDGRDEASHLHLQEMSLAPPFAIRNFPLENFLTRHLRPLLSISLCPGLSLSFFYSSALHRRSFDNLYSPTLIYNSVLVIH